MLIGQDGLEPGECVAQVGPGVDDKPIDNPLSLDPVFKIWNLNPAPSLPIPIRWLLPTCVLPTR